MSSSPTRSIRWAPIVAVLIGALGLMIAATAEAFRLYGLPFTLAALIIGGIAAYNNRRERVNLILGTVAALFGAVSSIVLAVLAFG